MSDDQRAQWDLLREQQAHILDELRDLRLRVDTLEAQAISLETRVSSIEMRLDTVDQRLSTIEAILIRMTALIKQEPNTP
jgi:predicted  nucleic acid-binding Zn-ribbon protein